MKRAIIGRRVEVLDHCREHGIDPRDPDVILVSHPFALRGVIGPIEPVWVNVIGFTGRAMQLIEQDIMWINATAPREPAT